jgi:mRNA-degrading endonuclease YafQ of YafQ-DinJ toxin-antitoxin module
MDAGFRKKFIKQFSKLPKKVQEHFYERLDLFKDDPFDPMLNNHELSGVLKNVRSINITGDIRAIYEQVGENRALFLKIGNHNNLYN